MPALMLCSNWSVRTFPDFRIHEPPFPHGSFPLIRLCEPLVIGRRFGLISQGRVLGFGPFMEHYRSEPVPNSRLASEVHYPDPLPTANPCAVPDVLTTWGHEETGES